MTPVPHAFRPPDRFVGFALAPDGALIATGYDGTVWTDRSTDAERIRAFFRPLRA